MSGGVHGREEQMSATIGNQQPNDRLPSQLKSYLSELGKLIPTCNTTGEIKDTRDNSLTAPSESLREICDWRIKGRYLYYLTVIPSLDGTDRWLRADRLGGSEWDAKIHSFWVQSPEEERFYRLVSHVEGGGTVETNFGDYVYGTDCSDMRNIVFSVRDACLESGADCESFPGCTLRSAGWRGPIAMYWRRRKFALEQKELARWVEETGLASRATAVLAPTPALPKDVFFLNSSVVDEDDQESEDEDENEDEDEAEDEAEELDHYDVPDTMDPLGIDEPADMDG